MSSIILTANLGSHENLKRLATKYALTTNTLIATQQQHQYAMQITTLKGIEANPTTTLASTDPANQLIFEQDKIGRHLSTTRTAACHVAAVRCNSRLLLSTPSARGK